jgi:hypothetical protein
VGPARLRWAGPLTLVRETWLWDDPEGPKWAAVMAPPADAVTGCFLDWLPKATYPVRYGVVLAAQSRSPLAIRV